VKKDLKEEKGEAVYEIVEGGLTVSHTDLIDIYGYIPEFARRVN